MGPRGANRELLFGPGQAWGKNKTATDRLGHVSSVSEPGRLPHFQEGPPPRKNESDAPGVGTGGRGQGVRSEQHSGNRGNAELAHGWDIYHASPR